MNWMNFSDSDASWDHLVTEIGNPSPFQLSSWAKFRSRAGWATARLVSDDRQTAIQVLLRRVSGVMIGWAAGGPLGPLDESRLSSLPSAVRRISSTPLQYLRISDFQRHSSPRFDTYIAAGWRQPRRRFASGLSLERVLSNDPVQLRSSYTSNWSRNLKRGRTRGVTAELWRDPDPQTIAALHRSVANIKRLELHDWRSNTEEVRQFLAAFEDRIRVVRATSSDDDVVAIRGAVTLGDTAYDFLAATSDRGRKVYASNVALDQLLIDLSGRDVIRYDFGGVDWLNNRGVYDFKHGAGGYDCEYVGEFEHVLPSSVSALLSRLVSLKRSV